jgi:D-arabinose 1-dehydrogenase-like Zn-dependent alcohol dehydrogenase
MEAAPLMCAGITTYNALRNSGARPGDIVGILGMGGLGHLGIQFAAKMGFHTVAIGRSGDKEGELMKKLGARQYIDNRSQNAVEELNKLGGAKVILATVPSGRAMTDIIGGLSVNGKLVIIGASDEPIQAAPSLLILGRKSLIGWPAGTSMDSQDTLLFSVLCGVRSMNEIFPLERAAEAYDHMMSGKAKYRCVLTTGN